MDFSRLLKQRRSCRKFSDQLIDNETIRMLLEDTFTAPSSKNTRSTRLAVVRETELLDRISTMRDSGSSFVKDAEMAIVVMGDTQATDLWRENCAISATILQLSAEARGLGSCWVHVHQRPRRREEPEGELAEEYLKNILDTPENWGILCVIALGYPAESSHPHKEKDDSDKVIYK